MNESMIKIMTRMYLNVEKIKKHKKKACTMLQTNKKKPQIKAYTAEKSNSSIYTEHLLYTFK